MDQDAAFQELQDRIDDLIDPANASPEEAIEFLDRVAAYAGDVLQAMREEHG